MNSDNEVNGICVRHFCKVAIPDLGVEIRPFQSHQDSEKRDQ